MPHKIEVAPSGRASCRGCKQTIVKGVARFAEEYASPFSEDGGLSFRYWHLPCAALKLANELRQALATYEGPVDDRASLDTLITEHARPPMPYAERASSGRARCRGCDENIAKGELRFAFERTYESPAGPQNAAAYAHARCVARYLKRETERGREAPALAALLVQVRANSTLDEADLATAEDEASSGEPIA
jgi:hypothetical protein